MTAATPTPEPPGPRGAGAESVFLLTPGFGGADGISSVSRSSLSALAAVGPVWMASLADREPSPSILPSHQFLAGGSRLRLAIAMGARAFGPRVPGRALALHLHLAPLLLPLLCRHSRLFVFLHGIEAWQPIRPREAALLRRSRLIANSQATVDRFRAAHPDFQSQPVAIAHLGIPRQPPAARSEFPAPRNFALITGRMAAGERYKGHDTLIDLWPSLLRAIPDAHLVIAGDGDDRPRLQQKAAEAGLASVVHFTGRIPDEALAALYRDCRFFVMPSHGEGFGLVFLEAMRAGKACLAGPGAAEEIVVPGQTGWIADPCQPETLLARLQTLFLDAPETARLGARGYQRFLAQFTDEAFARRLFAALELNSAAPAPSATG